MSGTETESGNGDFPAPTEGFVLTHTIIVQDRSVSCQWYERMLDGKVVMELSETGGPCVIKSANSWIVLNVGGGDPTVDKPNTTVKVKEDHHVLSAFLNIRVADVQDFYQTRRDRGAEFITEPKDNERRNPLLHERPRRLPDRSRPGKVSDGQPPGYWCK